MADVKRVHPAWIGLIVSIVVYTVVVSGFAFTNNTKTNRNEKDIEKINKEWREEVNKLRKEQMVYNEKVYNELKEIRERLPKK